MLLLFSKADVLEGVTYVLLLIDSFVYGIVNKIYMVYMNLARARIFSSELFTAVSNRVYAVVGIVMLFVLAYTLIQGIISPDKISKGAGSGEEIIKRVLKAVIGLALVPAVFNLAYRAQDIILANDVIGKIFLGFDNKSNNYNYNDISIDGEVVVEGDTINQNEAIKTQSGTITAVSIWQAFFYAADRDEGGKDASQIEARDPPTFIKGVSLLSKFGCGIAIASIIFTGPTGILASAAICSGAAAVDSAKKLTGKVTTLEAAYGAASASGDFGYFPAFARNVVDGDIKYLFILSTIAGIACIYLFLSFAIDMAVRAAKLAFLELIAPVPLMMQIMPNSQETYTRWYKNCLSLFFEVFIRLAMVYIIVYLIAHLGTVLKSIMTENVEGDFAATVILKVILIFGLLIFAKEAPKFITDALGIKANLSGGIGIRNKLDKGGVFAVGAAAGGIGANMLSGVGRGFVQAKKQLAGDNGKTGRRRWLGAAGSVISAPFMGIGQGARAVPRAIFDSRGPNAPHDVREMVNRIKDSNTSVRASMVSSERKKDEKKKDLANRAGVEEGDNLIERTVKKAGARLGYNTDQIGKRISNFTGIPRDTTYYSEQAKNAASLAEIGKALDATVESTKKVQEALRNEERMKSDATERRLAQREANVSYGGDISQVYANEEAMRKIHREQDKLISEAQEQTKIARAEAVQEALAEAATGSENATSRKLAELLDSKREDFAKHGRDRMASGKTLDETLREMFGDGVLSGHPDYSKAAQQQNKNMDITVTGNDGKGGSDQTARISLRTKLDASGKKMETKYYFRDGSGVERSVDTMGEALAALGIKSTTSSKAHVLGNNVEEKAMIGKLHDALATGGFEFKGVDDSTIDSSTSVADLEALIKGDKIKLNKSYLEAIQQAAGYGNDWEIGLKDNRIARFDAAKDQLIIIGTDGSETTVADLDVLATQLKDEIVHSSSLFTGEKSSIVSDLKTLGAVNQSYVISSEEYQEAMRNKQTNSGGGKK